jgi:hypothetical protein
MLDIDKDIFNENLLLTQAYCELQLKNTDKNYASILRSINPVYDGKELFSYTLKCFSQESDKEYKFLTEWGLDPLEQKNNFLYDDLFEKQLKYKSEMIGVADSREYNGKILIAEIDSVVTDGISEFESDGFIDINDCPPIDTWFYQTKKEDSRVLFAWIPEPFVSFVNKGIEVNMLNTFNWYLGERSESSNWHAENLGEAPKAVTTEDENPPSVFSQIKKLFS